MEPIRPYAKHVTEPDVNLYWAIGLMTASVVVAAVGSLVLANYASLNPPIAALKGTTLARVIIGVSAVGSFALGLGAGICKSRRKLSDEDEARLERQREIKALCKSGDRVKMSAALNSLKLGINSMLLIALPNIEIKADGSTNVIQSNILPVYNNPDSISLIREYLADYKEIQLALRA